MKKLKVILIVIISTILILMLTNIVMSATYPTEGTILDGYMVDTGWGPGYLIHTNTLSSDPNIYCTRKRTKFI